MSRHPRHLAPRVPRTALAQRGRTTVAAAGALLLTAGMVPAAVTGAAYSDKAAAQLAVQSSHWATSICVIWSNETRADKVFTIASHAPLGQQGWTNVVDKTAATTPGQLAGCSVVMIAGEAWGVQPAARDLALAWFNAGGKVLSTGNDTGVSAYPLPSLIATVSEPVVDVPYGGNIPASAAARAGVSPAFPSWTPGAPGTYELDNAGRYITAVAAGAVCVGTVPGHPEACAAIARTNGSGRWVHLHTKVGSVDAPGDVPMANAALTWLAAP